MKRLINLLPLALIAFSMACNSGTGTTTANNNSAVAVNNTNATGATKNAVVKASTPTEAAETLFQAMKNRDKETVKKMMSKKSLEALDEAAKEKKTTLDEVLDKQLFANIKMPEKFQTRNEKINGDRASVESTDETGNWTPTNFVREDGVWKIALMD